MSQTTSQASPRNLPRKPPRSMILTAEAVTGFVGTLTGERVPLTEKLSRNRPPMPVRT